MSETTTARPGLPVRKAFKTVSAWLPKEAASAARAISRHGRDVENTTLYLLGSVFGSYAWDKAAGLSRLRPEADLRPGSAEALAAFRGGIAALNADRKKAVENPAKPGAKSKTLTLIPPLGEAVETLARILLDPTLLERVVRARPDGLDHECRPAYARLPAELARGFFKRARQGWSDHLAAVKAWSQKGGSAGRPRPPGYRKNSALPPIELAAVQSVLPRLGKRAGLLFSDEAKTIPLTDAEIAAWDGVDLGGLIREALEGRWGSGSLGKKRQGGKGKRPLSWATPPSFAQVKSLRIMIEGRRARLLMMVEVDAAPPARSFHAELATLHPAKWSELSVAGKERAIDAWIKRIAATQSWLRERPELTPVQNPGGGVEADDAMPEGFCVMGVDLGVANVAALACSDGSKGIVLSGKGIEKALSSVDRSIDALVSALTTPEQRGLDASRVAARANGELFPQADKRRHRELSRAVQQNAKILSKRRARERAVKDFAHQAAATIAKIAAAKRAAFVIVGRNIGWKQESELGKEQNRRFHRIPHGRIIALLREKLLMLGISLIETEESWTSQASFADHEDLSRPPEPEEGAAGRGEISGKPPSAKRRAALLAAPPAFLRAGLAKGEESGKEGLSKGAEPARAARRGEGKERHWLFRQGPWPLAADRGGSSRQKVHADVNGAYNMIRKVCPCFRWHEKLSLKHELWGLTRARGYRLLAEAGCRESGAKR